ncbi:MAG: FdhD protein [Methanosarcinales archaeon]|nr:MAG: Formate dehydrogenase family accessory protein FdhD [Euryarchaeota archaeon 55_53]KUK30151.1 MAG: Formate dehydrogenase family accessory protein FdhD [Methanosarcinales archeaon 56_1174]MDI3488335.1 FdhD protein [Methanosarcinales archaeon]MDN5294796.1 FdhD protein [Methanosarcinales archaeon]
MGEDWHANRTGGWVSYWREEPHDPSAPYLPTQCIELSDHGASELEVDVVLEQSIGLVLNDRPIATLLALPRELTELGVGFLLCEGLLDDVDELRSISVKDDTIECRAALKDEDVELWMEIRSSGCIGIRSSWEGIEPISSEVEVSRKLMLDVVEQLRERATLWRRTGGTHSSLVCTPEGDVVAFCEDVSRACSVDKAIGTAVLSSADLSECALITTGRLSGGMVAKAARAGVPIVVSKAAPLSTGVELARALGMTLVAFARGSNLYVYAGSQRVV